MMNKQTYLGFSVPVNLQTAVGFLIMGKLPCPIIQPVLELWTACHFVLIANLHLYILPSIELKINLPFNLIHLLWIDLTISFAIHSLKAHLYQVHQWKWTTIGLRWKVLFK